LKSKNSTFSPSTQNFFANWSEGFQPEEYPTRPKPLIVLTLLMLSLAATALAQAQGDENGAEMRGMGGWWAGCIWANILKSLRVE